MLKQKVLIIEDSRAMLDFLRREVKDGIMDVRVFGAVSIGEGERLVSENLDADVVVMDACVPGAEINTVPLVRKIREEFGFRGPMIAMSTEAGFRRLLKEAGCDYEVPDKEFVPEMVIGILLAA